MEQPPQQTHRRWFTIGIIAGLLIIAASIWLQQRKPTAPVGGLAPAPAGPQQPSPDFQITMYQGQDEVGGQNVRLTQVLAKGKPVVLNFFAGLCSPCRAEMPDFQKRYDAGGKDQYVMLAVDIGPYTGLGTREDGKALLRELNITFSAGTVFDEDILTGYQIFGMPSTFFITPNGMIIRRQIGMMTPNQMGAYITELIRASETR